MTRYHVNPSTGETGACRATNGGCPFGGDDAHHPDPGAARESYESSMKNSTLPESLSRSPRDVDSEVRTRLTKSFREYQEDPRTPQQQWSQDKDKPLSELNPNHPRVLESVGAQHVVEAEYARVEYEAQQAQQDEDREAGVYHWCLDCGDPMEGYGPDEYPPDYCDSCEGDHEDEY